MRKPPVNELVDQNPLIATTGGSDLRKFVTRKATTCGNVIGAFAEAC
jgi:hypothetical protein